MRHSELIGKLEDVAFEAPILVEHRELDNYSLIDELISGKYDWLRGFLDRHIAVFVRELKGGCRG